MVFIELDHQSLLLAHVTLLYLVVVFFLRVILKRVLSLVVRGNYSPANQVILFREVLAVLNKLYQVLVEIKRLVQIDFIDHNVAANCVFLRDNAIFAKYLSSCKRSDEQDFVPLFDLISLSLIFIIASFGFFASLLPVNFNVLQIRGFKNYHIDYVFAEARQLFSETPQFLAPNVRVAQHHRVCNFVPKGFTFTHSVFSLLVNYRQKKRKFYPTHLRVPDDHSFLVSRFQNWDRS
jgi:hypothetical protein